MTDKDGVSPRLSHPATLVDVARAAGVSPMTVSRVVNNSRLVSASTRERVERAMESVGYIPNSIARSLVQKRTGVLALLVSDITHTWFTQLGHEVEGAAAAAGYLLVFGNTDENELTEREYAEKLSSLHVDGVLLAPASRESRETIELLQRRGIPVVLIDREVEDVELDIARGESYTPAIELTDHLIAHGHTRLGIVAGPDHVWTAQERVRGFKAALRRRGLPVPRRYVRHAQLTRSGGAEEARKLLASEDPPSAILAGNSYLAAGIVDVARERGLRIPEDLALVTFDDSEGPSEWAFYSCYEQPARAIGAAALRFLLDRLAGDRSGARRAVLRGDVRLRASCGCLGAAPLQDHRQ